MAGPDRQGVKQANPSATAARSSPESMQLQFTRLSVHLYTSIYEAFDKLNHALLR